MKKNIFHFLSVGALFVLITSTLGACRKEAPDLERPEDYLGGNFEEVFESFWNGMNNNYVFWDQDTTDWDRVYRHYKPLFAEMNLNDTADIRKSYTYFKEMTQGLSDGHYTLQFNSALLADSGAIQPSAARNSKRENARQHIPLEYFYSGIPTLYLDSGYKKTGILDPGFRTITAVTGTIEQDIAYLSFNSFNLKSSYTNEAFKSVLDDFFNRVKADVPPRGVIIDLRGNGGGALADLDFLLGGFITEPLHFGYTKSKMDNNRLDYSQWIPAKINPTKDSKKVDIPFVVIVDQHSVSMSEITATAVQAFPKGGVVGERTWGGQGPLIANFVYNGGQYRTSFMNLVYTSSMQFVPLDKVSREGFGFTPNREVNVTFEELASRNDTQLAAAVEMVKSK
ncbi:S41 family peptidase [Sphingobacterium corticis]|uniref:S41 family peptidase n=1 Tax=Sphingobacterium corticis TaxID=1812823 RepID=A0ABW5NJP7_9SPHI